MWKKIIHHRLTYFFVFVFAFFFISSFGLSQNTFATSVSYTFNGSSDYSSESFYCKYSILVYSYNPPSGCSNLLSFVPAYVSISTNSTSYIPNLGANSHGVFAFSQQPGNSVWSNIYTYTSYTSSISTFTLPTIEFSSAYIIPVGQYRSTWEVTFTFYDSVPTSVTPSGSLSITENGTFDVTNYAEAVVDVPSVGGDYSDDLQDVKNAILIGTASLFVIYFFWAIYKMIMGAVRR